MREPESRWDGRESGPAQEAVPIRKGMPMKRSEYRILLAGVLVFLFFSCSRQTGDAFFHPADDKNITYSGRIDFTDREKPRLTGAGATFQFGFRGRVCELQLRDENRYGNHNYLSVVLDGQYRGRIPVTAGKTRYRVADSLDGSVHTLLVCKATESQIGYIEFSGVFCEKMRSAGITAKRRIEFIGNSITCGMGMDIAEIPCNSAEWYDQHNAYWAYGPLAARELQAEWLLSSVSGIGIARNWNSPGPTMPEVYDHTYLDTLHTVLWDSDRFVPDLVSVCLGTNDFSDGDAALPRTPVDSAAFVGRYIAFLKHIRNRYPNACICCLSSPALSGEKQERLVQYLMTVVATMQDTEKDSAVHLVIFNGVYHNGCSGHPDMEEHRKMAEELVPVYRKLMQW